jgi:DNA-binding transcriptional LysR family regulator
MSLPDLEPELLRAFLVVAQRLSFTSAAAALNRTQSAVSGQIKRLEASLGATLFERTTTRVALTPAGEGFVDYARRILQLGEEAVRRVHQHDVEGRVRLGVMDDYGAVILPPVLKTFSDAYPDVEIVMETGLTSGMVHRLARDFDLVIAMHGLAERSGEQLRREKALWAGPPNLDPRTLDPLPVALYPVGCLFRKWALEALDRSHLRWRLAFVSHSLAAVEAIASQGLAVTVVKAGTFPKSLVPLGSKHGLPPLPRADIRLHRAPGLSAAGNFLAEHIRRQLETTIGVRPVHSA